MEEQKHPEVVVGAYIFNDEGKLLLVRSPKWANRRYVSPGGHIEFGETIAEAVIRETKEETELDVDHVSVIRSGEVLFDKTFHKPNHMIFFHCRCMVKDGTLLLHEGLYDPCWVTLTEAIKLPLTKQAMETVNYLLTHQ
jgi:nucleoside triphosphatase